MKRLKYLSIFLALLGSIPSGYAFLGLFEEENKKPFVRPGDQHDFDMDKIIRDEKLHHFVKERLGKIKYAMIIGNLERAKIEIIKFKSHAPNNKLLPILDRYMAMIHFLEEDYDRSLKLLNNPLFSLTENRKKICHLRIMNMIILNKTENLNSEWTYCKSATDAYSENRQDWLQTLIDLKNHHDSTQVTKIPFKQRLNSLLYSHDHARIWLKLGLYLNQSQFLYPLINQLDSSFLRDDEIRELIGLLYFRDGELVTSYQFIEDLSTPNVENIKGNLYLMQEKYELAFAQFKLALQMKNNSLNALERILPLSWKLQHWNDGVNFTNEIQKQNKARSLESTSLEAAFLTQMGKYPEALGLLKNQHFSKKSQVPLEMTQLITYNSLRLNRPEDLRTYSTLACQKFDALYCWLMYQASAWDNFSRTIERDEKVLGNYNDFLQEQISYKPNPLEEETYVDQRDIEELDQNLIEL